MSQSAPPDTQEPTAPAPADKLALNPDVDPTLMDALVGQESGGSPNAVSYAGAKGPAQLMDNTGKQLAAARGIKYDAFNPEQNKALGSDYLAEQVKRFGSVPLGLTAYNAGPEKLARLQKLAGSTNLEDVLKIPENEGGLLPEQRVYAEKVQARYDKLKAGGSTKDSTTDEGAFGSFDQQQQSKDTGNFAAKIPDLVANVPSTTQGFSKAALPIVTDPYFNTLPFDEKANVMTQLLKAKNWNSDVPDFVKKGMDYTWDASDPSTLPDLSKEVGPPPVTPDGTDPKAALDKWKAESVQQLLRKGQLPAIYGSHLDTYLDNASKAETEAYGIRNQNTTLANTGNYLREIGKTILGVPLNVAAGAVRLDTEQPMGLESKYFKPGIQPFSISPEHAESIANTLESLPEYLGKPSQASSYATEANGQLKLHPDGTPITKPEEFSGKAFTFTSHLIGNLGGFALGGELISAYKGAGVAATALLGANFLSDANESYKSIYNQTNGDVAKAYRGALLAGATTAPIQSIGELGAISRYMSPVFSTMNGWDQLRYLAVAFTKGFGTGVVTGGGADIATQLSEKTQTGQPYSAAQTGLAALGGGVALGAVGAGVDYYHGKSERYATDKFIKDFGNHIDQTATAPSNQIDPDLLKTYGMDASPGENGSTTLSKRSNPIPEAATAQQLASTLEDMPHQKELDDMGERQKNLLKKETRTPAEETELNNLNNDIPKFTAAEHLNTITATENAIDAKLQENPGEPLTPDGQMARYDRTKAKWVDPVTGEEQTRLKDLLFKPKAGEQYTNDLSDISHIKILDEEALNQKAEVIKADYEKLKANPPEVKGTEEALNIQRNLDKANRELNDLKTEKDNVPKDDKEGLQNAKDALTAKTQEIRDLQNKISEHKATLDTEQAAQEAYKNDLKAKEEELKQNQKGVDRKTIERIKKKGLGASTNADGTPVIAITAGMTPEAKEQVTAHEIAHAISDKIELTPEAKKAVSDTIDNLKSRGAVTSASDIANQVMLPEARKQVKIPDTIANKLTPKSKEALYSEKEFLANQIGAVILKRAGKDIGDFKILPEVEAALNKTKLPELPGTKASVEQPTEGTSTNNNSNNSNANETGFKFTQTNETTQSSKPSEETAFNFGTGEQKETAFSKTLSEANPNNPKVMYDVASRIQGQAEAKAYIEKVGIPKVTEMLGKPESYSIEPKARVVLSDELLAQTRDRLNSDPTPANRMAFQKAKEIRSAAGTSAAQQLAMFARFRAAKDFPELLAAMDKAYKDAGQKPPEYTDYMLKELKAKFDSINKLPESQFKNSQYQKLFESTLKDKKLPWGDFLTDYALTNILSGFGTDVVVGTSSLWMSPIVTGLSHPYEGGALSWRAMWNIMDLAKANAINAFKNRSVRGLVKGALDSTPLDVGAKSSVAENMAAIYRKFSDHIWGTLAALHTFSNTLGTEGYRAHLKYQELKAQYGNDPAKFSSEVAKIITPKEDKAAALIQAEKEAKDAGVEQTENEKYARAYEILRNNDTSPDMQAETQDYSLAMSHRGQVVNPLPQIALGFFNAPFWQTHPYLQKTRLMIQPVGRALIGLSDYGFDFIPGNKLVDMAWRDLPNYFSPGRVAERSPALKARLRAGQMIGTVFAGTILGLSRSGAFKITGDPEKPLGKNKGQKAFSRGDIKTAEETGDPEFSFVFPNGAAIEYKDFPGLNDVAYGVYRFNKAIDSGEGVVSAIGNFYRGAISYATPFFGGGTLNSPTLQLGNDLLNPEANETRMHKAFEDFAVGASKMAIPWSARLRDLQQIYDAAPEESHQNLLEKIFRNVPGMSTLVGSKVATDRFAEDDKKTFLEHLPGISRIATQVEPPANDTWAQLRQRGLYVKEMGNTEDIVGSNTKLTPKLEAYQADRSARFDKMYANVLTPDEWNAYRKATGPYIKSAAQSVLNMDLPTDRAQEILNAKTNAIELQAKKHFVATGKFYD